MTENTVEDNLELVTFIQMTRMYDVLMALLQESNPVKAQALYDLHEKGDFLSPPPSVS